MKSTKNGKLKKEQWNFGTSSELGGQSWREITRNCESSKPQEPSKHNIFRSPTLSRSPAIGRVLRKNIVEYIITGKETWSISTYHKYNGS